MKNLEKLNNLELTKKELKEVKAGTGGGKGNGVVLCEINLPISVYCCCLSENNLPLPLDCMTNSGGQQ